MKVLGLTLRRPDRQGQLMALTLATAAAAVGFAMAPEWTPRNIAEAVWFSYAALAAGLLSACGVRLAEAPTRVIVALLIVVAAGTPLVPFVTWFLS